MRAPGRTLRALALASAVFFAAAARGDGPDASATVTIDSISIHRNWITWDRVILNELEFREGDEVTYGAIDTSMKKIWNIGNFAEVDYKIHKMSDGRNHLQITALDALVIQPLLPVDYSSIDDYDFGLGVEDKNFIGTNIKAKVRAGLRSTGNDWDFRTELPRQLLYKNMTLQFGYGFGNQIKRHQDRIVERDEDGRPDSVYYRSVMATPYKKSEVYGIVGNPFHLDYRYRFSPDLSWKYMYHKIDSTLAGEEERDVMVEPYTLNMLALTFNESVGMVNSMRHRKDGYRAGASITFHIGLDKETPGHQSLNFDVEYHKLFNNTMQLSTWYRTGYTNSELPALWYCKGSGDVLGHRSGEIYGKAYYSAYLGMHFTWFNYRWLSLENAYFFNWGNGTGSYLDLYRTGQKWAAGTSFRFMIPVIPWLYVIFIFTPVGTGSEWFKFKNN
jgi:outer membrane protein assembly factor BamA